MVSFRAESDFIEHYSATVMQTEILNLLNQLGTGKMSATAYDTAWVARLGGIDRELSNRALEWLCENQLTDGSWGTREPFYYHDRVISTLSAMLALTERGRRTRDRQQIENGLLALEKITEGATMGLQGDPGGATVGFEMIAPTLVAEAEKRGIIKQQGERILGRLSRLRQIKMEKLNGLKISRYLTPAHSAEMAGEENIHILDIDNLQEQNGSVGNSPSSTAYFALFVKPGDQRAMDYLRWAVFNDGGAPTLTPIELFEGIWVLWNLSVAGISSGNGGKIGALLQNTLDYIERNWKPGKGLGFSTSFSITDSDDTAVGFELLGRDGRQTDLEAVLGYEEEAWFRCFQFEANPSVDVNVHVLGALRFAGCEKHHPVVRKIIAFIRSRRLPARYWLDKWHVSPFYTTSHIVMYCKGYDDQLCEESVDWILRSQKANGSWGFYGFSTAEETAYCVQALHGWGRYGNTVPRDRLTLALNWLRQHANGPFPPLWIDKSLYCPDLIVRSAILSALILGEEY